MMKAPTASVIAAIFAHSMAGGQEIPNGSFEQPPIQAPVQILTPGQPGYAEAEPDLRWSFGAQAGICPQRVHFAERVDADDGQQVAFMQGNIEDNNPATDPPSSVFGIDLTGLEVGQEYEISWKQTGRITDTGQTAVSVVLGTEGVPPLNLMTKEPVGTRGEWEDKSLWFLATAPTMRFNVLHHIVEAGNSAVGSESTLFDNFKLSAGRSAN